jgi:hypothetical protein
MAHARIEVLCPPCVKKFFVSEEDQGTVADCPTCGGWIGIPMLGRPPTDEEAERQKQSEQYQRLLNEDEQNLKKFREVL